MEANAAQGTSFQAGGPANVPMPLFHQAAAAAAAEHPSHVAAPQYATDPSAVPLQHAGGATASDAHARQPEYAGVHSRDDNANGGAGLLLQVPAHLPDYAVSRAGPPGGSGGDAATRRHHTEIKPKDWAGGVVWAKLARYPWWPAQVLSERDPYIPVGDEPPRRGAVPVRFFGTYEFSWIESQRALAPFDDGYDDKASKSKAKVFVQGIAEALHFQQTGELPAGFTIEAAEPAPAPGPKASKTRKATGGKAKARKAAAGITGTKGSKKAGSNKVAKKARAEDPSVGGSRRSGKDRRDRIMRLLALKAPIGSPYAGQICLAGLEGLQVQTYGVYTDSVAAVSQ